MEGITDLVGWGQLYTVHCVPKKVTPRQRTTEMSDLNKSKQNFVH